MSKLKRCPICDEKVVFDIFFDDYTDTIGSFITCRHCDLKFYGSMDGMSEEQLADEWNTRIPMEKIVERLEDAEFPHKIGGEVEMVILKHRAIEIVEEEM